MKIYYSNNNWKWNSSSAWCHHLLPLRPSQTPNRRMIPLKPQGRLLAFTAAIRTHTPACWSPTLIASSLTNVWRMPGTTLTVIASPHGNWDQNWLSTIVPPMMSIALLSSQIPLCTRSTEIKLGLWLPAASVSSRLTPPKVSLELFSQIRFTWASKTSKQKSTMWLQSNQAWRRF